MGLAPAVPSPWGRPQWVLVWITSVPPPAYPRPGPPHWPWVKSPLLPSPCSLDPITPGTQAVPQPRCSLCLECPPLLSVEALLLGPQSLSAQFPPVLRESRTDSTPPQAPRQGQVCSRTGPWGGTVPLKDGRRPSPFLSPPFSSLLLPGSHHSVRERRPWLRGCQPAWRTWVDRQVAHFNL